MENSSKFYILIITANLTYLIQSSKFLEMCLDHIVLIYEKTMSIVFKICLTTKHIALCKGVPIFKDYFHCGVLIITQNLIQSNIFM